MLSATARSSVPPALSSLHISDVYSDARTHGYVGPSRTVRLQRVTSPGGGAIAKSDDGSRCVVAGKESLRILRLSEPVSANLNQEHKSAVGKGGHRIDASRNFWEGSGLKIDSTSTDVAWCHGPFNNKILTSALNGEIIVWDLNKSGSTKYEQRSKDHIRSIQTISCSTIVPHYCVTGSADGDVRVWDLRSMNKSIQRIHQPASVRSVVFSPSPWKPLQLMVGLDNGSLSRWDLQMGQRGRLDRRAVAHAGPILSLDWRAPQVDDVTNGSSVCGGGWVASGGLDHQVKLWDLSYSTESAFPPKPAYTLCAAFPARCVLWRPDYPCEVAIVGGGEFGPGVGDVSEGVVSGPGVVSREKVEATAVGVGAGKVAAGDAVEIWDVRRAWVAKWEVTGSAVEGGVTDITFADSHAVWAQHTSGAFAQLDLRESVRPVDAIPRTAVAWNPSGSLAFACDKPMRWEVPYDDIDPKEGRILDSHKRLGDSPYLPSTQYFGNYTYAVDDSMTFRKLARRYIVKGTSRADVCSHNAEVAFHANKPEAAQAWLLIASLLPTPAQRLSTPSPFIPKSPQSPAIPPSPSVFPVVTRSSQSRSSDIGGPSSVSSRRATPSPSHSPSPSPSLSPRRLPAALPQVTSKMRRPSHPAFGRRESLENASSKFRARTASPNDGHGSLTRSGLSLSLSIGSSLRHVGGGALDDSDSDSDTDERGTEGGVREQGDASESHAPHATAQHVFASSRMMPSVSSPLRKTGWTDSSSDIFEGGDDEGEHEDEDEEDEDVDECASPSSTDSEYGDSSGGRGIDRAIVAASTRGIKTQSHGSTVAAFRAHARSSPPPIPLQPLPLLRQESHVSVRTVTADGSRKPSLDESHIRKSSVDLVRGMESKKGSMDHSMMRPWGTEIGGGGGPRPDIGEETKKRFSDKRRKAMDNDKHRFTEMGWEALRDTLEAFAEAGDVQMCAFMSLIVPEELQVNHKRVSRFLESYIEQLHRLKLFKSASYLRKHAPMQRIRAATGIETVIYTSCARCRKPIILPGGPRKWSDLPKGGYAYCIRCKLHTVRCSICHLPVRTLLFQCSVCNHGGHQDCYRRYYMVSPPVEMRFSPTLAIDEPNMKERMISREGSLSSLGGSEENRQVESGSDPDHNKPPNRILGRACAAGCGHFCWATSANFGDSDAY